MHIDLSSLASAIYEHTCRIDFEAPGFFVRNFGPHLGSVRLRQLMLSLKCELARIHEVATKSALIYQSVGRFSQIHTTRLHVDAGPKQSLLILGYEPSDIESILEVADYSKCAFNLGITPDDFMLKHNPIFAAERDLLKPYTNEVAEFSAKDYQLICINNSSTMYCEKRPAWQGLLHSATILAPDPSRPRILNSILIAPAPLGSKEAVSRASLRTFTIQHAFDSLAQPSD